MKITWLGHACFLIESADGSIVFDPYEPEYVPGLKLPELTAEVCLCSHGHGDHSYSQAVSLSGKEHNLKISRFHSFHDENEGALRGENLISVVECEGFRLAHMGDLGHDLDEEAISALGKIDVLMIPIGGFYTIDSETASKIAKKLSPKLVIPMHYKGKGFGFDVLETVEKFLSLQENSEISGENSIIFDGNAKPIAVALRCPLFKEI